MEVKRAPFRGRSLAIHLLCLAPGLAGALLYSHPARPVETRKSPARPLHIQLKKHEWIDVDPSTPDDAEMLDFLKPYMKELRDSHGQVLAHSPKGLNRGGVEQHNEVGFWVADVMRDAAEAATGQKVKLALINAGGIRVNIPPGPVTYGKLCEVMPFDNELVVAEYTGEQVQRFILQAVKAKGAEPCSGLHIQIKGPLEKPEILLRWEDGSAIDPQERVWVAVTDYLLASGDKSPDVRKPRQVKFTGRVLRDLMKEAALKLNRNGQSLRGDFKERVEIDPVFFDRLRNHQGIF